MDDLLEISEDGRASARGRLSCVRQRIRLHAEDFRDAQEAKAKELERCQGKSRKDRPCRSGMAATGTVWFQTTGTYGALTTGTYALNLNLSTSILLERKITFQHVEESGTSRNGQVKKVLIILTNARI